MAASKMAQSLASLSDDISKELDSLADRAFELAKQAKSLQEHSHKRHADKGVQAAVGSGSQPAYKLDRATRLDAFHFQPLNKKMNWKKIRGLNLDRTARETDTSSLMDLYNTIAYADLSSEGVYELCESNLLKVIHACQLLLQFQQHNVEQACHAQQLADEQCNELAAALQRLPELSMTDVKQGLQQLEGGFYGVADADLDAMFTKARVEERTAASNMVTASAQPAVTALAAPNYNQHPAPAAAPSNPQQQQPQQQQQQPRFMQQQPPQQPAQYPPQQQQQQQYHQPQQQQPQLSSTSQSTTLPGSAYSGGAPLPPPAFPAAPTVHAAAGQGPHTYPPLYQPALQDSTQGSLSLSQGGRSGGTQRDSSGQQGASTSPRQFEV
ncbi:MAG: hypothetical protein WDW38_000005 [Sanguina aurantia]